MRTRIRSGSLSAALAITMAVPLGVAATAAQDWDPTAEDVAVDSLLQLADVPASASSDGVSVASDPDLRGYRRNGGLREVSQTWFSDDPTTIVFDFRWQFPDGASAQAFLDAAEEELSEVSSGAQPGILLLDPLPDTRFYAFEDRVLGTDTVGFNFLMRHENLVAKVYVSGSAPDVSQAMAEGIAGAAAQRIVSALTSPAAPPPASADEAALAELLLHVPAVIRDGCTPSEFAEGALPGAGEQVRVTCASPQGGDLTFMLFDTVESLDAAYDTAVQYAQVFGTFGGDGSCEGGGYEDTWTVGDVEAGRLLCNELQGDASVVWTHPESRILSMIRQGDADHAAAWQLWLIAGPE